MRDDGIGHTSILYFMTRNLYSTVIWRKTVLSGRQWSEQGKDLY